MKILNWCIYALFFMSDLAFCAVAIILAVIVCTADSVPALLSGIAILGMVYLTLSFTVIRDLQLVWYKKLADGTCNSTEK